MPDERQHPADPPGPRLALRRHTDRCFHAVEEVVPLGPTLDPDRVQPSQVRGYIVDGILIDADDVAEVRTDPGPTPGCPARPDTPQGDAP